LISGRYLGLIYKDTWMLLLKKRIQYKMYCNKINNYIIYLKKELKNFNKSQCSRLVTIVVVGNSNCWDGERILCAFLYKW
jgi:hypothetical protein